MDSSLQPLIEMMAVTLGQRGSGDRAVACLRDPIGLGEAT